MSFGYTQDSLCTINLRDIIYKYQYGQKCPQIHFILTMGHSSGQQVYYTAHWQHYKTTVIQFSATRLRPSKIGLNCSQTCV